MDRFSPYHTDAAGFGLVNVRPMAPFSYLYPFERQKLMEIAYYFDFDYADGRTGDAFAREPIEMIRFWMADADRGTLEMRQEPDGTLRILDTRRGLTAPPRQAVLRGWKAAVYLACDQAQTLDRLIQLPEVQREAVSEEDVRAFLGRCVHHRLMVDNQRSWLGVAVHVPPREGD